MSVLERREPEVERERNSNTPSERATDFVISRPALELNMARRVTVNCHFLVYGGQKHSTKYPFLL